MTNQPPPDPYGQPQYPSSQPGQYGQQPGQYGQQPGQYGQPQYPSGQPGQYGQQYPTSPGPQYPPPGQPGYPPPPPPGGQTNTMAIVSLVCALAGILIWISAPVGAILGHVAKKQIRESGEQGDGMAMAGIIVGWIVTGLGVLGCCLWLVLVAFAANA